MNRTEPHRRRLFLKTLLMAAAPVPAKAFSGAGRMEQEIFDAIHSLALLKGERDIELFLRHRRQQVEKIEKNISRYKIKYEITFKNRWQPFSEFVYIFRENGRLSLSGLDFKEIGLGEIIKEFSQLYFAGLDGLPPPDVPGRISKPFLSHMVHMGFVKKLPQGTLCFGVWGTDSLMADDYGDLENDIIREERLSDLPVDSVSMRYGQILKGNLFEDDPSYEQN